MKLPEPARVIPRRDLLKLGVGGGLASAAGAMPLGAWAETKDEAGGAAVVNGRIRQSIMGWCFKDHMDALTLAKHCKEIGLVAMEGISSKVYPEVLDMGLEISLVSGGHGFSNGPCNPEYTDKVIDGLSQGIELAVEVNCPSVITFTGMRFDGMDDEAAAKLCVETWKKVLPLAEEKDVTIVLEHLNSRDDTHKMKGHPGYFGDDVDFCLDMVKEIGSPNFKLLFDIYHVSIMNGDIIRRIRKEHEYIGHYHTAGNPGRGELDENQEINYPAVMREILKTGYEGYVAQEFIPTWDDPVAALRHAAALCDV
jgi:hydroxypyruvate isomerase